MSFSSGTAQADVVQPWRVEVGRTAASDTVDANGRNINGLTASGDVHKSVAVGARAEKLNRTNDESLARTGEEYFKAIRHWEGVVDAVNGERFFATMRDTAVGDDRGDEQFEILIDDVDEGDRDLIVPGGIFYLTVGYRIRRGQRLKGTQIVFRRMPRWSKFDIARAQSRADRLMKIVVGQGALGRTG